MENNTPFNDSNSISQPSKMQQFFKELHSKLNEQEWYIELKTKWDEVDPQNKIYIKWSSIIASSLGLIIFFLTTLWNLHSLKNQINTKSDLLLVVQSAQEELRRLKEQITQTSDSMGTDQLPWSNFFDQAAVQSNIDKALFNIGEETPGSTGDIAKESLFEVKLTKVNIKQLVKFAYYIENGTRPAKVRQLSIETHPDLSGYMDAKVAVSGFSIKGQ